MFFDAALALAALPELGARTRALMARLLPGGVTLLLPNPRGRWPLAGGDGAGAARARRPGAARRRPRRPAELGQRRGRARRPPARRGARGDPPRRPTSCIDAGELPGTPSTVIDLRRFEEAGEWAVVRAGAVERDVVARAVADDRVESRAVRRLLLLVLAALLVPRRAAADVRLPGPLVALAAGPGSAYAVVSTTSRTTPFRLVRSRGRSATSLARSARAGAEFADVAAGRAGRWRCSAGRPPTGFSYELADGAAAGGGDRPAGARARRRGAASRRSPTTTATPCSPAAPTTRHADQDRPGAAPRAARRRRRPARARPRPVRQPLRAPGPRPRRARRLDHLDRRPAARSPPRSRATTRRPLRRVPRGEPADARHRPRRRRALVPPAPAHQGQLNGAPAVARVGLRTFVATSQRAEAAARIFLTTVGPAGTLHRPPHRTRADPTSRRSPRPAPTAASTSAGPADTNGSARRAGLLRRVL